MLQTNSDVRCKQIDRDMPCLRIPVHRLNVVPFDPVPEKSGNKPIEPREANLEEAPAVAGRGRADGGSEARICEVSPPGPTGGERRTIDFGVSKC